MNRFKIGLDCAKISSFDAPYPKNYVYMGNCCMLQNSNLIFQLKQGDLLPDSLLFLSLANQPDDALMLQCNAILSNTIKDYCVIAQNKKSTFTFTLPRSHFHFLIKGFFVQETGQEQLFQASAFHDFTFSLSHFHRHTFTLSHYHFLIKGFLCRRRVRSSSSKRQPFNAVGQRGSRHCC